MDTRFLESFLVVVESGSIAEAARRLNLTAAALSDRIRALEGELGVRLLMRDGRTVQPTEAGRAIFERAQRLLSDVRELRNVAGSATLSGILRIGAVSTALTGLVPAVLSELASTYPGIEIHITPGSSDDLYRKVQNGEVDAAVMIEPPFPLLKTCDWTLLREEPLVVISPASEPIDDPHVLLTTRPFIRYDRNHWGGRLADHYLQMVKIYPRARFELDALDAIAVMVDRGLGVSLVPDWAPPWPSGLSLRKVAVNAPTLIRRIGLLWMRNSTNIRFVHTFRAQAATTLGVPDR